MDQMPLAHQDCDKKDWPIAGRHKRLHAIEKKCHPVELGVGFSRLSCLI